MKKILPLILIFIMIVAVFSGCHKAPNEYFEFILLDDGTYEIIAKNANNLPKDVVIPEEYDGKPVTSIGDHAFSSSRIKSVTIPDSVTSIGGYAFCECSNLKSVMIPDSITEIGDHAFLFCKSLKYNEYENTNYLGNTNNPYHTLIDVKDRSITNVKINENTKIIYNSAFMFCINIASVTIPDGVTSIGYSVFEDCSSLTSVTIPDSVTSIGHSVFKGCSSLTNFTIPDGVTEIGNSLFYGCSSLTNFTIPGNVTSIGGYAFYGCENLTSMTIPDSVVSIGNSAFSDCSALPFNEYNNALYLGNINNPYLALVEVKDKSIANIKINEKTKLIVNNVFNGCSDLADIDVDGNNEYLTSNDNVLFNKDRIVLIAYPNSKASDYTIPNGVTKIEDYAFSGCSNLTNVTIPGSVTTIGEDSFRGCSSLTSVIISEGVTSIGDMAFSGCSNLTSVIIPNSVTTIGGGAFEGSIITDITYKGTKDQWDNVSKGYNWIGKDVVNYTVHCTDGDISK